MQTLRTQWNNEYAVICRTGLLLRAVIFPKKYRDNSVAGQNLLEWMRAVVAEISRQIEVIGNIHDNPELLER